MAAGVYICAASAPFKLQLLINACMKLLINANGTSMPLVNYCTMDA